MKQTYVTGVLAVAALALLLAAPVQAQTPDYAAVVFVPTSSSPPPPPGLNVNCIKTPSSGAQSDTCPVVVYHGITTWAYSYNDNRVAMLLVSYDEHGKTVRSVNHDGARYVWNMLSSLYTKTVLIEGQSNNNFTVPWSQLGQP
jgi:hypothetical protein